ncbi:MAG: sigma-70 family RNA polymerase sigma factor [Oscillospiraceae bacterium]|jgi:RNA polymerase sigma factor (sigma-70 family)|nr:sigma-70 family RNA polymerase sigma factor [Oscillospiraceae bacterium]
MDREAIGKLAAKAAAGDSKAFQDLYLATRQKAYYVALSITKNEADAQDIVQDAYIKAYQHLPELADPESFGGWLNQITANHAKNYITRKKPDFFADYEDENAVDWQEETDIDFIPDERLDREEAKKLVQDIVASLPEDQRLVVLMHYFNEMEVQQIAKTLDIPEGTVKSRLSRARGKLEAMLNEAQKKGMKLYAFVPIPFFAFFLKYVGAATSTSHLAPLLLGSAAAAGGTAAAAAAGGNAASGGTAAAAAGASGAAGGAAAGGVLTIVAIVAACTVAVGGAAVGTKAIITKVKADKATSASVQNYEQPPTVAIADGNGVSEVIFPEPTTSAFMWLPNNITSVSEPVVPGPEGATAEATETAATTTSSAATDGTTVTTASTKSSSPAGAVLPSVETTGTTRSTRPFSWPSFTTRATTTTRRTTTSTTAPTTTTTASAATTTSTTTTTTTTATTTTSTTTASSSQSAVIPSFSYFSPPSASVAAPEAPAGSSYVQNGVLVRYSGNETNVVVKATAADDSPVVKIGSYAFLYSNAETIVIEPGLQSISWWAFACCEKLTSITIPETVTDIDRDAFIRTANFTIKGIAGSAAEQFALAYSIPFESIPPETFSIVPKAATEPTATVASLPPFTVPFFSIAP